MIRRAAALLVVLVSGCDKGAPAPAEAPSAPVAAAPEGAAQEGAGSPQAAEAAGSDDLSIPDKVASSRDAQVALERSCKTGDAAACNDLGKSFLGRASALPRAVEELDKACLAGSAAGCNNLGVLRLRGVGSESSKRNTAIAIGLLEKACQDTEPLACQNLGRAYEASEPKPKPPVFLRAAAFYQKACTAGADVACVLAAVVQKTRIKAKKSDAAATGILEGACDRGLEAPCLVLGRPVPADKTPPVVAAPLDESKDPASCPRAALLKQNATSLGLSPQGALAAAPSLPAGCDGYVIY